MRIGRHPGPVPQCRSGRSLKAVPYTVSGTRQRDTSQRPTTPHPPEGDIWLCALELTQGVPVWGVNLCGEVHVA
eukprot:356621-Chlamydomonas_euryale.AAC.9